MAALLQLLIAAAIGAVAWFLVNLAGVNDPWPVVIGVIVFLACLGMSVVFVDSDWLD